MQIDEVTVDTHEFESNLSAVQGIREDAGKVEWALQDHDVMSMDMAEIEAVLQDLDLEYLQVEDLMEAIEAAIEDAVARTNPSRTLTIEV